METTVEAPNYIILRPSFWCPRQHGRCCFRPLVAGSFLYIVLPAAAFSFVSWCVSKTVSWLWRRSDRDVERQKLQHELQDLCRQFDLSYHATDEECKSRLRKALAADHPDQHRGSAASHDIFIARTGMVERLMALREDLGLSNRATARS